MLDGNEFGRRAQEIKIKEISFHIDWNSVARASDSRYAHNTRDFLYPILTLEREGKTKRVSLYRYGQTKHIEGKLDTLGLAILCLVQGNAISKPAKDSINMMWITYTYSDLMKLIRVKLTGAASRKSIISQIEKFKNKENRNHAVNKLKAHLQDAFKAGLKKQDVTNTWDSIVNEYIVADVMED